MLILHCYLFVVLTKLHTVQTRNIPSKDSVIISHRLVNKVILEGTIADMLNKMKTKKLLSNANNIEEIPIMTKQRQKKKKAQMRKKI